MKPRPRTRVIFPGDPARTIYTLSGVVFLVGLPLILLEIVVFGFLLGAPEWGYPAMWVTLAVWGLGALTMCATMLVEVIARMRGKRATFGIATLGGRLIGDLREDGATSEARRGRRRRRRSR